MPGDCGQNWGLQKESTHTLKSLDSWFDVPPAPQHLLAPRGSHLLQEDTGAGARTSQGSFRSQSWLGTWSSEGS